MKSITDIKHAFYINLASRPDRKEHVEKQLQTIGIQAERFNAINLSNGAIGCSMSHLKCLEIAKKEGWSHLLIVEDDIKFLKPELFKSQLNNFLSTHSSWDVILIAGNNFPPYQAIDDTCIKVATCQTTTGYIVNGHYFDILIDNFRRGIKKLVENPEKHTLYAIDKYWFHLQKKDNWYLIIPLSVTQREDYSDIEKRSTNYAKIMLDIDKEDYFKRQMEARQILEKQNQLMKAKKTQDKKPTMSLIF
jgi:GR25 family glycosyltransferase involved in LPS biosynthesis